MRRRDVILGSAVIGAGIAMGGIPVIAAEDRASKAIDAIRAWAEENVGTFYFEKADLLSIQIEKELVEAVKAAGIPDCPVQVSFEDPIGFPTTNQMHVYIGARRDGKEGFTALTITVVPCAVEPSMV